MKIHDILTISLLILTIFLVGCATPYQPAGAFHLAGGGYSEKKISDSAYWVSFSGNGYAKKDRVVNFWLYRCAELTIQSGYQYMFIRPGENAPVSFRNDSDLRYAKIVTGEEQDSVIRIVPAVYYPDDSYRTIPVHGGGGGYTYIPGGSYTVTTWGSKGTVLMYHAPLPEELVWAVDAHKVMDMLAPFIQSNNDSDAPSFEDLIKAVMVTHEDIAFGDNTISITKAEQKPLVNNSASGEKLDVATPQSPNLRNSEAIRTRFESQNVVYHALFRERDRVEKHNDAGEVVLAFDITPNGSVSGCRVTSTTFVNSQLPDAVANVTCRITFPPQDVALTSVQSFHIKFTPHAGSNSVQKF